MDGFLEFFERSKQNDIFIILGSQGAGTNLLARFLGHVFDFSVVRDKALIFKSAIKVRKDNSRSNIQYQLKQVYDEIFPSRMGKVMYKEHHGEPFVGIEAYFDKVNIATAKEFAYFFYAYSTYFSGKSHFAIKSDDIWEDISELGTIFEQRKIILLTRDFRDNVLSMINKNFGPKNAYAGSFYVKKRLNLYYREYLKNPTDSMQVNYESLLTEPHKFIESFAQTFDRPPMLEIEDALQKLKLRTSNFKKWEQQMSSSELLICESILHDELKTFNYPLRNDTFLGFSLSKILSHRLHDCALRVPQKAHHTYQKFFATKD